MNDRIVAIANGYWNIRGTFKVAGLINIGTQASLVRLKTGTFVFLGAYTLEESLLSEVLALTDQGRAVEAILHLHPFHTGHINASAAQFPSAKLYGTSRHVERAPDLAWQPLHTDDPELHELFAADFTFTVPRGVEFISNNEKLHFSSVLAFHPASRTLHVDDTLTWVSVPWLGGLIFHPTLAKVLLPRAGAAQEFRQWAQELATRCEQVDHLCTAHMRRLPTVSQHKSVADQVRKALARVEGKLSAHERRFG